MSRHSCAAKTHLILFVAVVLVWGWSGDSVADEDWKSATHWGTLKFQGTLAVPLGENEVEAWNQCDIPLLSFLDFYSAIKVNTAAGVIASFEYVFARRVGVEVSFVYWSDVVELEFVATGVEISGSPNFTMPTLGANYHFLTGKMLDLYAGGFVALGVIATGWPAENIEISSDVALGINAGLDYYFNKSWSLGATLKYIDFGEIDFSVFPPGFEGLICNNGLVGLGQLNFLSVTVGVGYRFL